MPRDINMTEWSNGFVVGAWGELDGKPIDREVVRAFIAPTWSAEQIQGFVDGCALHERKVVPEAGLDIEIPPQVYVGCWVAPTSGPATFLFVAALIRRARHPTDDYAFDDEIIDMIAANMDPSVREDRRLWPSA